MENLTPKKLALAAGFLATCASSVHAAPIIEVYSDTLDVSYYVETVSGGTST